MTNHETGVDARVSGIDLEPLKRKLAEEKGWTEATLNEMDKQYRQFLNLKLRNPTEAIVPTRFIDEMWHSHILDTRAYARDSQDVFGRFLHHFPYLGVGGPQEKLKLDGAFEKTAQLWHETYGEDYRAITPAPQLLGQGLARDDLAVAGRCENHSCHVPSSCACRSPGACKDED